MVIVLLNCNRDEFLKSNLSFVITDEKIFSEIIEKISFKQIILINYSGKSIQNTHKETEVISIDIPFRFSELNSISNRLNLITSQNERVINLVILLMIQECVVYLTQIFR